MFCTSASIAVAMAAKPLAVQESWSTGLKCGLDTIAKKQQWALRATQPHQDRQHGQENMVKA